MNSSSLLQLLPELLNQASSPSGGSPAVRQPAAAAGWAQLPVQRAEAPWTAAAGGGGGVAAWVGGGAALRRTLATAADWAAGGDTGDSEDVDASSRSSDDNFGSVSQDQDDVDDDERQREVDSRESSLPDSPPSRDQPQRILSPKPVDLDDIEKFLEGITHPHRSQSVQRGSDGRPAGRDMAALLQEVDELGQRTLSSHSAASLRGSPRSRPSASKSALSECSAPSQLSVAAPATPAGSQTTLAPPQQQRRRHVRFSQQQLGTCGPPPAPLCRQSVKLCVSEPALVNTSDSYHELLTEEKRKNLNLTADMILLKQSSLEQEIQLKRQRDDQVNRLLAENAALRAQVEHFEETRRNTKSVETAAAPSGRLRSLEHRLQEQERLLDGFNEENARLYRQLKSIKTEREQLESTIDDLQCDKRLLEARLQASRRHAQPQPAAEQLAQREEQLQQRWLQVQRAGQEVARLHQKVRRQQEEAVCEEAAARRWGACDCVSAYSQTEPPAAPLAAAAEAELRTALRQAQAALVQHQAEALQTEARLRKDCDLRVRTLEAKVRRLNSTVGQSDTGLMCTIKQLKSEAGDKERQLLQQRRQLEKLQRTVASLQRERERLLASRASSPDPGCSEHDVRGRRSRTPTEPRAQRASPPRSVGSKSDAAATGATRARRSPARPGRGSPARPGRGSAIRGGGDARSAPGGGGGGGGRAGRVASPSKVEAPQRAVDETLLCELQTAIAAVEEENALLRAELTKVSVHREEEISRRDAQIAKLLAENEDVRSKLAGEEEERASVPRLQLSQRSSLSGADGELVLSEARAQLEAQERVIRHLRQTVIRFREQVDVMEDLEQENQSLRETVNTLHAQLVRQRRSNITPGASTIDLIESKLDQIDRQSRRRAGYLRDIARRLGHCSLSASSLDGTARSYR